MGKVKLFEDFNNSFITLYHGTCLGNAEELIKNGWTPRTGGMGGNMGQPKYLYLTTDWENAMWYAEEKGCNTIIQVTNIPMEYLKPDPEDEAGYTMSELLDRMKRTKMPSNFVLTTPLSSNYFKIYKK